MYEWVHDFDTSAACCRSFQPSAAPLISGLTGSAYCLSAQWIDEDFTLQSVVLQAFPGKYCARMDLSVTVKDGNAFIDSKEPGRNPRQQTILNPQHPGCVRSWDPSWSSSPSAGHLPPGQLQLTLGWIPNLCD